LLSEPRLAGLAPPRLLPQRQAVSDPSPIKEERDARPPTAARLRRIRSDSHGHRGGDRDARAAPARRDRRVVHPDRVGIGSLILVLYGALRRLDPDRIGRLALLGTLIGGVGTAGFVLIALLAEVLS
jgi:hypothetical protein